MFEALGLFEELGRALDEAIIEFIKDIFEDL